MAPWLRMPENEAAWRAVQQVRACLGKGGKRRAINPLYLHGPSGTGKTHLMNLLVEELVEQDATCSVRLRSAAELLTDDEGANNDEDAVLLEDLQRLPTRRAHRLIALMDRCLPRQVQLVMTATVGPALLDRLPVRLTSRLASGLVVGLAPLGPASRLLYLRETALRRELALSDEVLHWLADHLPGTVRQLDGALTRLGALGPLTLDQVRAALQEDSDAHRATVERIAQRVGRYYRVGLSELRGPGRGRGVLLPRQVGMYLARRHTELPLEQIGAYFGGRDHSTVLHACRKVEQALETDAPLSQAVRELSAGLT